MQVGGVRVTRLAILICAGAAAAALGAGVHPGMAGQTQIGTTLDDFFQPGTQPGVAGVDLVAFESASVNCHICHSVYLGEKIYNEPFDGWVNSMMGQSARDPVWRAALTIANQDASFSGEYCIRCHAPAAWLEGRSIPADGSAIDPDPYSAADIEGVTCHFCHRLVNPVLEMDSPSEDAAILAALPFAPGSDHGNGRYVIDPTDVRRGPYEDIALDPMMNAHGVPVLYSPWHSRSEICGTCHDVRNPAFTRQKNGTYVLNSLDSAHPTQEPGDMFPEQTTYSEWLNSDFAQGGVYFADERFGGNHPTGIMQSCQDCHMPDQIEGGCAFWENPPWFQRTDLPQHTFAGSNTWVLKAVRQLYPDWETSLSEQSVNDAIARVSEMLRNGSDTQVMRIESGLRVRVINWSGHKLPTGYPEGRRMWLNVQYYDGAEELVGEHGAYDYGTAVLTSGDTKVYETIHVLDAGVAAATGLPANTPNHLVLNNLITKDNRIPPVGFTNAAYDAFDGEPVAASFADGQHWDDSTFVVPPTATRAVVTLNYQSMTKEYIEFLRDANVTNLDGQTIYDLWNDPGGTLFINKVPPVDMDMVEIDLDASPLGDVSGDGTVGFADLTTVLLSWGPCPGPDLCASDLDGNGQIGFGDLVTVLLNWG